MNATIYNADRATHGGIVVASLIAAITITAFAVSARLNSSSAAHVPVNGAHVLKAQVPGSQPIAASYEAMRADLNV